MKVAVPLFGSVVAPRFGFANEFLVAEVVDHEITRTERVAIDTLEWHGRLAALQGRGITVLLHKRIFEWVSLAARTESIGRVDFDS